MDIYQNLQQSLNINRSQAPIYNNLMDPQNKVRAHYLNDKAGMSSVNAQVIAKRVAQLTNGSPKDLHQKQLTRKRQLQIAQMLQKVTSFKKQDRQQLKSRWEKRIQLLDRTRPLQRYWGHFDFDMFYVACELLDKPQLRDKPCAVGGDNSVLCTANYMARMYGVRSAMPTFIAKKLCPQLILFKPNFDKYRKYSEIFRQYLRRFDQNLQSHGLDQAYIDLTEQLKGKQKQKQQQFLQDIRAHVFKKTGLTISCGIGANKLLAKMASQVNKPDGQHIVENKSADIMDFMINRRIRKIHGIGPVNQFYLKGLGIHTAKDLLQNTDILAICFSQHTCQFFVCSALGIGAIQHEFKQQKSVSKSQTFRPSSNKQFLQTKLLQLCQQVSRQLQEMGSLTLNVILSYQYDNFQRKDRSYGLDKYTTDKDQMYNAMIGQLRDGIINPGRKIRLLGVKCSHLQKIAEWKRKNIMTCFARSRQRKRTQLQMKKGKKDTKSKQKISSSLHSIKQQKQQDEGKQKKSAQQTIKLSKQFELLLEVRQKSQFICPVCEQQIKCMNNLSAFNRHVDKCLKNVK